MELCLSEIENVTELYQSISDSTCCCNIRATISVFPPQILSPEEEDQPYRRLQKCSSHSGMANPLQIVSTPPAPINGCPITVFWASRLCGPAGWLTMLLIKVGDVETRSDHYTKKVWICDICHRHIQVRKQISTRCNRIEH